MLNPPNQHDTLRRHVYDILENKNVDSPLSQAIKIFLIGLIIINVITVIASSIKE